MLDFIELPKWIDRSEFFKAFLEMDRADDLYTFFGCNNSTAFSMFMKKYIKDKPDRVHYIAYVRELIKDEEEFNKELGIEPKLQQAETETNKPIAKPFMLAKPKKEHEIDECAPTVFDTSSEWLKPRVKEIGLVEEEKPNPIMASSGHAKSKSSAVAKAVAFREDGPTEEEIELAVTYYHLMIPSAVAESIKVANRSFGKIQPKDEDAIIKETIAKGVLAFDPRPYLVAVDVVEKAGDRE